MREVQAGTVECILTSVSGNCYVSYNLSFSRVVIKLFVEC